MKFIDEALIHVIAGNGGRGCVSFRREKYVPRGGPDGGDGGKGGDVAILTTSRKKTLSQFRYKRVFKAENGGHGQGKQKTGKDGKDLLIEVPPGTLILNADTQEIIKDCITEGEIVIVARGGKGGKGNSRFASSTNRAPRYAQPGLPGESFHLKLDLKLLADVGIVGFPNAGKSTFISRISSARPKIADYPFTTLSPVLGVVTPRWGEPFVVADIPGLIQGAHHGVGLGVRFLRHIERTRILLHLIDASAIDPDDPLKSYTVIKGELAGFSKTLLEKPCIIVLNKMDLPETERLADRFAAAMDKTPVFKISALTGMGLDALMDSLNKLIQLPREPHDD